MAFSITSAPRSKISRASSILPTSRNAYAHAIHGRSTAGAAFATNGASRITCRQSSSTIASSTNTAIASGSARSSTESRASSARASLNKLSSI
ncbi:hypothetical protein CMV30_02755 [Nibricoccus aquaticus]|uniref:Uncharacterized protein n=1 Tax=Nibricoccus aquaticus TaxID=2576891 RepID=A0A290Q2T0_9BACT|nr:hypothetical protein CMV30_02755 [Nibricoccus aquaticus]